MKRAQSRRLGKRLRRLERRQDTVTREVLNAVARILEEYLPEYEIDIGWALPNKKRTRAKREHSHVTDSFTRKANGAWGSGSKPEDG